MSRKERLRDLEGQDLGRHMQRALQELRQYHAEERRRAEVDGKDDSEVTLEAPVMVFEMVSGWKVETIGDVFAGQNGPIVALDATEPLAMAEFRMRLRGALIEARWCKPDDAKRYAARARVTVHGRVLRQRIQVGSTGNGQT